MSDDIKHEGTIDTNADHYEITAIDRATKKVLVNFSHNGHGLHHTVLVEDVEDTDGIRRAVEAHYEQYKGDVEKAQAQQTPLPESVLALVGQKVA